MVQRANRGAWDAETLDLSFCESLSASPRCISAVILGLDPRTQASLHHVRVAPARAAILDRTCRSSRDEWTCGSLSPSLAGRLDTSCLPPAQPRCTGARAVLPGGRRWSGSPSAGSRNPPAGAASPSALLTPRESAPRRRGRMRYTAYIPSLSTLASRPGLARPSTKAAPNAQPPTSRPRMDVDGRAKPGHDGWVGRACFEARLWLAPQHESVGRRRPCSSQHSSS
jgi:hypothetical protein